MSSKSWRVRRVCPTAFYLLLGFYCDPTTTSLFHYILPPSRLHLCSWVSHTDFLSSFFCFFLLQIFLDLLFFHIDDLFLLFCMWLFIQWCPLIGARLFPLSLLNFILTFEPPMRGLYIIFRCFKSNRCSSNQYCSPYMNKGDSLSISILLSHLEPFQFILFPHIIHRQMLSPRCLTMPTSLSFYCHCDSLCSDSTYLLLETTRMSSWLVSHLQPRSFSIHFTLSLQNKLLKAEPSSVTGW